MYSCFGGGGSHSQCLVRSPGVAVSSGWCECGPLLEVACYRYWLYACSQPNQQYEQCRGRIGGGGGRPLGGRRRRTGPPAPGASCCSSSPGGGGGSSSGSTSAPPSSHEPAVRTPPSAPCHVPHGARDAPRAQRPLLLLALWNSLLQVRWSPRFSPPPQPRELLCWVLLHCIASCRLSRFLESAGIRVCDKRLWSVVCLLVVVSWHRVLEHE